MKLSTYNRQNIGRIIQYPYRNYRPGTAGAFRQEYRLEADVHMNVNTRLFPDTLSTLKELKKRGARVGIISTKYRFRILSYLEEYLPKDFLDIVVGGEDVKAPKLRRKELNLHWNIWEVAPKRHCILEIAP